MKQKLQFFMTIIATVFFGSLSNAQCAAGEAEVTIDVTTDTWGYESYWEVTPTGDACGVNTFFSTGTAAVGCAGGGAQSAAAGPNSMPNSATTTFTVGCFTLGTCLDLHSIDDWGDGGTQFDIKVDGNIVATFNSGAATEVFNFCVTDQATFDMLVELPSIGTPYSLTPLNQATPLMFSAQLTNNGSSDVTTAYVNVDVSNAGGSVATATSATVSLLTAGSSQVEAATPSYTVTATGAYIVEFVGFINEADENLSNDSALVVLAYTDTVLARDNGTVSGSLGIGAGSGTNAKLGQVYNSPVVDTMTSITAMFVSPTVGDTTHFSIYDMSAGTPNAEVAATAQYIFTAADTVGGNGIVLTLMLATPFELAANTNYVVMVNEYANNATIATNNVNYEASSNWVFWDANGWSIAETLGATFGVNYVIRANFGGVSTASISETEMIEANIFPNPTQGNVTVELAEAVSNASLTVYSVEGTVVSSQVVNGSSFNVNLEGLNKGMYIIELNNGSSKGVYRVTKN